MKKLTPLKSIRKKCVDCQEVANDIKNCEFTNCPLYPFRMRKGRAKLRDIRKYCLDCMNGQWKEVKFCPNDGKQSTLCPLYPYRFGKNPSHKGRGNPDALKKARYATRKKEQLETPQTTTESFK